VGEGDEASLEQRAVLTVLGEGGAGLLLLLLVVGWAWVCVCVN